MKILLSFLLLTGILSHSCTDEGIIGVSNWHQTFESEDDVLVRDAKALINNMQGEVTMLDMAKTLGKTQTRANGMSSQALKDGNFSFEWRKARSFKEDDGEVLIVPVKMKQNVAVWRFSLINNKGKKEQTPMYSVLYVKKLNRSGATVSRILSYAPARNHLRKFRAKTEIEWYDPTHTDYSGLLLVSSLNGLLSHAINFEKGHREYVIRPKRHHQDYVHTINTRAMVTDSTLSVPNKISPSNVVFFNMRTVTSNSSIRAYSYDDETYEQPGCIFCGGDPYTCDCFEVVVCEDCGYEPDNCVCKCIICNENPCACGYCETCHNLKEYCICTGNDGDNPPSGGGGGGGSTGGTGTGTGTGTGVPSIGGGSTNTSLPTITGGTVEQRNTIQNIIQELSNTYKLNMGDVNITICENGCYSSAKITDDYSTIEICPSFFSHEFRDQLSKLWHEMYHYENDDRTWADIPFYQLENYYSTPPEDVKIAIEYMVEHYDCVPRELYGTDRWTTAYSLWTVISSYRNHPYTLNEIEAYRKEIETFPNVSEYYQNERIVLLWQHEERLNQYPK